MLKYSAKEVADSLNSTLIRSPALVVEMVDCIGVDAFMSLAQDSLLPGTGTVSPVMGEAGTVSSFTVTDCDDCEPYQHEAYHL